MKIPIARLLLITAILSSNFLISQTHSFKINDGSLIWQNIYNKKLEIDGLKKQLMLTGHFEDYTIAENQIICNLKDYSLDYKSLGNKSMSTSIYIQQWLLSGLMVIDLKEGRYRVTFKNLKMKPKTTTSLWSSTDVNDLEFFILRKQNTEFRKGFLKNDAEIFERNLQKLARFKSIDKDDDW